MNNIQKLLMQRLNYSEQDSKMLCEELNKIDDALLPALNCWIKDIECIDITEYNGYSISSLCADYDMNFIAALITLDWIIKEPEAAIDALKDGLR